MNTSRRSAESLLIVAALIASLALLRCAREEPNDAAPEAAGPTKPAALVKIRVGEVYLRANLITLQRNVDGTPTRELLVLDGDNVLKRIALDRGAVRVLNNGAFAMVSDPPDRPPQVTFHDPRGNVTTSITLPSDDEQVSAIFDEVILLTPPADLNASRAFVVSRLDRDGVREPLLNVENRDLRTLKACGDRTFITSSRALGSDSVDVSVYDLDGQQVWGKTYPRRPPVMFAAPETGYVLLWELPQIWGPDDTELPKGRYHATLVNTTSGEAVSWTQNPAHKAAFKAGIESFLIVEPGTVSCRRYDGAESWSKTFNGRVIDVAMVTTPSNETLAACFYAADADGGFMLDLAEMTDGQTRAALDLRVRIDGTPTIRDIRYLDDTTLEVTFTDMKIVIDLEQGEVPETSAAPPNDAARD